MTTPATVAGDAVRLDDDERLDNIDAGALQGLIYEHIVGALGGLIGPSAGVLSNPTFNTTNLAAVAIGECILYDGRTAGGSSKLATGVVIEHKPTESWQVTSTVDLSSYAAGSGTPYIWAARAQTSTDPATRRKWVVGTGETSYSPNTRRRETVLFGASTTQPSSEYFKIAQVVSWASGSPTILPIHAFDLTTEDVDEFGERLTTQLSGLGHVGLARLATTIIRTLRVHYDKDAASASTWFTTPVRGLKQLNTDLASAESLAAANETRIFDVCTLFAGLVTHDVSGDTASVAGKAFGSLAGATVPVVSYVDDNTVRVDWSANEPFWPEIYAIHVTAAVAGNDPPHIKSRNDGAFIFEVDTDGTASDHSFYLTIIGKFVEAA